MDGLGPGELGQQVLQVRGGRQPLLLHHHEQLGVRAGLLHGGGVQEASHVRVGLKSLGGAHQREDAHRLVPAVGRHVSLGLRHRAGQGPCR